MKAEKNKLENAYNIALQPYEINVLKPITEEEIRKNHIKKVLKGLKCHMDEENKCKICPYPEDLCSFNLAKDALSLIKELTEENESLRETLDNERRYTRELVETLHKVHEERVQKAKADTVRKMQERLKQEKTTAFGSQCEVIPFYVIDQIAKEMLGE